MKSLAFTLIVVSLAFLGFTAVFPKEWAWVLWYGHKSYAIPDLRPQIWAFDAIAYGMIAVGLLIFVMAYLDARHRPVAEKVVTYEGGGDGGFVDFDGAPEESYGGGQGMVNVDFHSTTDSSGNAFVSFDDD